jgi:hypothetical protein
MKKAVFAVLAAGFLGRLAFAQSPNDFKIDFTKEGDGLIITGYTGTDTMVVIPAEIEGFLVRGIRLGTFQENRNITEVVFPDGVTEIPDGSYGLYERSSGAFMGCSKLTAVTLPQGLKKIGANAFVGCSSLTTINIPNTVTEIGARAFSGCSSLVSITIPNGVKILKDGTFLSCEKLASVSIPNTVTQIETATFGGCSGLTSITIPSSVTQIGDSAFYGCSGLTSVAFEEGAVIKFGRSFGGKLDVKSQIALKKMGYTGSF